MNVDYVRQVAAECDDLGLRLFDDSHDQTVPVHIAKAARLLAQAGAVLHVLGEHAGEPPRVRCQWCGEVVGLTPDGMLQPHSEAPLGDPWVDCAGSHGTDHEPADLCLPPESAQDGLNGSEPPSDSGKSAATHIEELSVSVPMTDEEHDGPRVKTLGTVRAAVGADESLPYSELIQRIHALKHERDQLTEHLHCAEHDRDSYRKRWHEAATQRDALVRAIRAAMNEPPNELGAVADLSAVVALVESGGALVGTHNARLRRELWHVLDRMPSSDDNLIDAVRNLKTDRNPAVTEGQLATLLCHTIRKTIDECPEPPGAEGLCRVLGRAVSEHLGSRAVDSSSP